MGHLRELLEELPGHVRVAFHERPEVPQGHDVTMQIGGRRHCGGPNAIADQCNLAEMTTWSDPSDLLAPDRSHGLPVGYDEEPHAVVIALTDDDGTRSKRVLTEVLGELLEMTAIEARQHRDSGQRIYDVRRHTRMLDRNLGIVNGRLRESPERFQF